MNCRQYQFNRGVMPRHDGSTCGDVGDEEECACGCTAYDVFCPLCSPEKRRYIVHKEGHPAWPPGNVGAVWKASELNAYLKEYEGSGVTFRIEVERLTRS